LKPQVIIYVSCNVQQLAKDLAKFKDYTIKSAAMFDLFPQTNHLESVVELVRK
jgi:tRNA/tmRNA/rRNA uracil-C5-methylase (TrmA/RlmC/RlmD family)